MAETYYMHTLDGRPAFFNGQAICFALPGGFHRCKQRLAHSLAQIRKEQQLSCEYRSNRQFRDMGDKYGYVRVHVEEERRDGQ